MQTPAAPAKPKTIAISSQLHRCLKVLSTLDGVGINELTEPALWPLVKANQARLEQALGEAIEIPAEAVA